MKTLNVKKKDLAQFFSHSGRDASERAVSGYLCKALSAYGAQAEYITDLANVWFTANTEEVSAKDRMEKMVYVGAKENALRYVAKLLADFGTPITEVEELALYRVMEQAWNCFVRRDREKNQ